MRNWPDWTSASRCSKYPMTPSTSSGRQILKAVRSSSADLTRFLRELVRARSVTGFEEPAQEVVRDRLKSMGADVDSWRPSRKDFAGYEAFVAEEKEVGSRPNVVARFRGSASRKTLAFNGHVDVVPEGDIASWMHPPYVAEVEGGRLYGRGACDMKAGLAATIFAVQALLDADVPIKNDILVESVIGEESSGMGTLATILRGYRPDAAIIAEPTSLKLVTVQAGCLNFRIRVRGKAAHGASRYLGVSAIEKFLPVHEALMALEEKRRLAGSHPLFREVPNPVPLSIGTLRAGDWDSTVPEELVAEGRYGVWPGEKLARAKRQFESAVAKSGDLRPVVEEEPPRSHVEPVRNGSLQRYRADTGSRGWWTRLALGPGKTTGARGITAGLDMRLFTGVARCPAAVFGPGDDSTAHFSDEFVDLDEVIDVCKVYATAALSWNE